MVWLFLLQQQISSSVDDELSMWIPCDDQT